MAWLSRVNFISSDTLSFSDINNLGNDIRAWGDNVNGGGYTLSNVALSASSGTMATVTGGTGAASTLTIRSTSGTGTSDAIVFQTASQSERMRITTGGNVGIGTPSPTYQTQVSGSGQTTAALTDSGNKGGSVLIADTGVSPGNGGALLFAAQVANGAVPGCAIKSLLINGLTNGQSDLAFCTRNSTGDTSLTERMRINASGNIGIGTGSTIRSILNTNVGTITGPAVTAGLTLSATYSGVTAVNSIDWNYSGQTSSPVRLGATFNSDGTGMEMVFYTSTSFTSNGSERVRIDKDGNVGIGTPSPAYRLQLSTDSAAKPTTNTWTIASDARLKTVRGEYEKGLAEICALRPVRYEYNGKGGFAADGAEHISILAQEAQEVFPECVNTFRGKLEEDGEEVDLLNYNGHAITFALINAIKELKAKIDILEARN